MKYLPQRKSIRLKAFDYGSIGAYFITICVKDRNELLGTVDVGAIHNRPQLILSEYGKTVESSIKQISEYSDTRVDKYVVMPNHVHMILLVKANDKNGRLRIAPTNISVTIQQLKRRVSKEIGFSFWQKSYHDHIIRSGEDYQNHWRYIDENPAKWAEDEYFVR